MHHTITDAEFSATYDPTQWVNPAVAVDVVLVDPRLRVFLKARENPPQHHKLGLVGAFVKPEESLLETCTRAVTTRAPEIWDVGNPILLNVFDGEARDIRGRVLSIAFLVPVRHEHEGWPHISNAVSMDLAFDHTTILEYTWNYLYKRSWDPEVVGSFLPHPLWTLSEFRTVVGACLGNEVDRSNFRKWFKARDFAEVMERRGRLDFYRFRSNNQAR